MGFPFLLQKFNGFGFTLQPYIYIYIYKQKTCIHQQEKEGEKEMFDLNSHPRCRRIAVLLMALVMIITYLPQQAFVGGLIVHGEALFQNEIVDRLYYLPKEVRL